MPFDPNDPGAYLKELQAKGPKPGAQFDPNDPGAYLKDVEEQRRKLANPTTWEKLSGSPVGRTAGDFLYGATHPTQEPDPNDPYRLAQQVGGYVPGAVAGMVAPETYLAQSAAGGISGAFAPAKDWKDRLIHTGEGAAAGLIPAPLRMIPKKYLSALDSVAMMALAHGMHASPLTQIGALVGTGAAHRNLSPLFELARHFMTNAGLIGRGAAQGSDAMGVTGGGQEGN